MISWDSTDLKNSIKVQCQRSVEGAISHLVVGKDNEGTAAGRLDNDRQEFWIYSTKSWIPTALGHSNIVIALFAFQRLSEYVTEFGASHNPKWHVPLPILLCMWRMMILFNDERNSAKFDELISQFIALKSRLLCSTPRDDQLEAKTTLNALFGVQRTKLFLYQQFNSFLSHTSAHWYTHSWRFNWEKSDPMWEKKMKNFLAKKMNDEHFFLFKFSMLSSEIYGKSWIICETLIDEPPMYVDYHH